MSGYSVLKQIEVVAAIIKQDNTIFATQRGYGEFKGGWEFPGGKIESGETPERALEREIKEDLNANIQVGDFLHTVEYDYPSFHLTMHCFICSLLSDEIYLNEHQAARWLDKDSIDSVEWLPADVEVAEKVKMLLT